MSSKFGSRPRSSSFGVLKESLRDRENLVDFQPQHTVQVESSDTPQRYTQTKTQLSLADYEKKFANITIERYQEQREDDSQYSSFQ